MEPFPAPTEEAEEEEAWLQPLPDAGAGRGRVVVHLDLDCFYAQVEMLHNPALRAKPLGVQQKSIVVTCNYEARSLGVKKLMPVKDAQEICPQLLLVNGEDLTPYRDMSYKVTELLAELYPLVERLGLDENFVDVTERAEQRLQQLQQSGSCKLSVSGHVYNNQALNWHNPTHLSLAVGSQLAEELREALATRLGLTSCAGVATNKLLSKLVSGTFKPNQQTILLPESSQELLHSLESIQKIPGIGPKTAHQLQVLGVRKVKELQSLPSALLEKELGLSTAQRLQKLSWGEDESPVSPSGPPQDDVSQGEESASSNHNYPRVVAKQPPPSLSSQRKAPSPLEVAVQQPGVSCEDQTRRSKAAVVFPPHVDPQTFSELPAEVQEELLAEWKRQGAVGKSFKPKGRRATAPNSLLRYFKPQ